MRTAIAPRVPPMIAAVVSIDCTGAVGRVPGPSGSEAEHLTGKSYV